jgi:hypothetical protein
MGLVHHSGNVPVVSSHGYGGAIDEIMVQNGSHAWILDAKSQKRKNKTFAHYPDVGLQLSAYDKAAMEMMPDLGPFSCASLLIATDEPGPHEFHFWFGPGDPLKDHYTAEFLRRLACWKWANGYFPTTNAPKGQE